VIDKGDKFHSGGQRVMAAAIEIAEEAWRGLCEDADEQDIPLVLVYHALKVAIHETFAMAISEEIADAGMSD
jgi:hypothetical protein